MRHILFDSIYSVAPENRKKTIFPFFNFVILWWLRPVLYRDKVECECASTNIPLSNDTKIVCELQHVDGEVAFTICVIQKRDGQTKNVERFNPWQHAMSELHQTWHGDRGGPYLSCFGPLIHAKFHPNRCHVLPLRSAISAQAV